MEIFVFIIMIINFFLSLWNAYASGQNMVFLENYKGKFKEFFMIANSFGLLLAFSGMAYVTIFFLSYIASLVGYINVSTLNAIASYNFLVFGGLITVSGLVIAVESILIAYLKRNFFSIFIAIYNVFASIWNLYAYISSFETAKNLISSNDDRDNSKIVLILIVGVLIAFFITYNFYNLGKKKAKALLAQQ